MSVIGVVTGGDRVEPAAALNVRGLRCKEMAKYDEGRALYERALGLLEREVERDQESIATLHHNLGGIEHARGNYVAGEVSARRGLAIRRSLAGADPRDLAADLVALAAILDGMEKYAEAEPLYLEALGVFERTPGANAREIAVALNDLGAQYARRGLVERAEQLLTRAASLKKETFGPEHPDLAVTLNNLAVLRKCQGDLAAAAALYTEAVEIFERSLGAGHPKTVTCLANASRCAAAARKSPAGLRPEDARVREA